MPVEPDPLERDQLTAAAQAARARAEELAGQVEQLRIADDARSMWLIETAVTRDKAESARVALGLRGLDLDHPGDRVTAQEWIDADTAARLAADAERAITELDIDPAHLDDRAHVDRADADRADTEPAHVEPAHETSREDLPVQDEPLAARDPLDPREEQPAPRHELPAVKVPAEITPPPADIRETSTPEVSERIDPTDRRRVPARDRTTADVLRARLAVEEIEHRRAAEDAQDLTRQAQPDDDRRAGLARRTASTNEQADEQSSAEDSADEDMTRDR